MAVKGLDLFKLSPKTNCRACGSPTCMAFCMRVAQGALPIAQCPHMSEAAIAFYNESKMPVMQTIEIGTGENKHVLGGETVLFRHEKTLLNRNLFAVSVDTSMARHVVEEKLAAAAQIDYARVGEREFVELIHVAYAGGGAQAYVALVKQALAVGRTLVLDCEDLAAARAAVEVAGHTRPVLNGANGDNFSQMNGLAAEAGLVLGVKGADLAQIRTTVEALQQAGNRKLVIDVTGFDAKQTFANAVCIRRAAIEDHVRALGYPALVNLAKVAPGDPYLQSALAAVFTMRYGSILVMEQMSYAQALPLYGLRQNIYTDPQRPMKVEPKVYPINGADENAPCALTVDFALTYFLVSSELERSEVPVNLLITDASGMSVLTAWAAGKFSASSVKRFFEAQEIARRIKSRTLMIPGKVAVLRKQISEVLPGWKVVVAPKEAVELVKFLRDEEYKK